MTNFVLDFGKNKEGQVDGKAMGGNVDDTGAEQRSLQDAFMEFRKKRQEDMRMIREMKEKRISDMSDPDRMWELRMKFLERAKSYYGVPYARRYHGPDSPDYNAPLFLDCCGLVRQVLLDLKDDFGFKVNRWNQAYQYDTLPITIEKEEDMKPGDLVFISAIYYNTKSKKQRHDMVHVELWAGEGAKSIGARWQKGHVQMFDSYKFEAKSYHSMVYHFKSIDTWLQGICRSHCPEHPWVVTRYQPGQKSVFAWEDQSEEDQAAEDIWEDQDADEDELCNRKEQQEDVTTSKGAGDVNGCAGENIDNKQSNGRIDNGQSENQTGVEDEANLDIPDDRSHQVDSRVQTDDCTDSHPVSPEDDDIDFEEDIHQTFNECSDCEAASITTLGGPYGCSRCCQDNISEPEDGDDGKAKGSSRDVAPKGVASSNSRSSLNQQSSQRGNGGRGRADDEDGADSGPTGVSSARKSSFKEMGPTFYIGGANGVALVEGPLLAKGWRRIHDRTNENFKLKWVELKSHINYHSFKPGEQLVNRIPNTAHLATKVGLLETLREYARVSSRMQRSRGSKVLKTEDFYPMAYNLDSKADREAFFQAHQDGDVWICKPNSMNQGKGIYLVKDISDIKKKYQKLEENGTARMPRKSSSSRMIQRYIPNPLLLDGKKFDVRAYLLIACTTPYVVFYHPGYLRLSCNNYDPNSDDLTLHLTNQYIQKKNPDYEDMKEDTVWSMDRFNDHVNTLAEEKGLPRNWVHNQFTKRMMQLMTHCFNAVKNKLQCKLGYFDLLGFDFLLDEDMKVYLLEVNVNPALHTNCETLRNVIPPIVHETLDVVLEIFDKCRHSRPIMPLASQRRLTLLYSEANAAPVSRHVSHSTSPPRQHGSPTRAGSPLRGARSRSTSPVKRRGGTMTSLRKNVTKMTLKDNDVAPHGGTG